jgi:hypothetical protein
MSELVPITALKVNYRFVRLTWPALSLMKKVMLDEIKKLSRDFLRKELPAEIRAAVK